MPKQKHLLSPNTLSYLLAIFFIVLSLASPWGEQGVNDYVFIKSYIGIFGLGVIILFLLYQARYIKQISFHVSSSVIFLWLLFIWGTLSIIWSVNVDFAISKWFLWLLSLLTFIIVLNINFDSKNLVIIALGLLISATLVSIIGIFQYFFDWQVLPPYPDPPGATFGNKNMAAQFIVLTLPVVLFLLSQKYQSKSSIWLISLAIAIMLIYVFYTTSRAAWLSVSMEMLVVVFYLWHNKRNLNWISWDNGKRNATIVFLIIIVLLMINFWEEVWQFSGQVLFENIALAVGQAGDANYVRYLLWEMTYHMIKDNPVIGTGLGSYFDITMTSHYIKDHSISGAHHAHNDLLETSVELGLVGLVLLIGAALSIFLSLKRLIKNNHQSLKFLNYLILAALVGLATNMQFGFPMQLPVPLILLGFYLGMIVRQLREHHTGKVITLNINQSSYKIFSLLMIIVVALVWFLYVQWIGAYKKINQASTSQFNSISTLNVPILHFGMPLALNIFSISRFDDYHYQHSEPIDKKILEFWPHHANALRRYALGISSLGRSQEALRHADLLLKNSPPGLYHHMALVAKIKAYQQLKQTQYLIGTFNQLMADENVLRSFRLTPALHRLLLQVSVENPALRKYSIGLYQNYLHLHGYNCQTENNIAALYVVKQEYNQAKQHINTILQKEGNVKCVNQSMIDFLEDK